MKNQIPGLLFICSLMCIATHVAATTRVVNNNIVPVSPGQYSTIGAAITASSDGDTILVTGSPTAYDFAEILLNKRLAIFGAGYNPKGANKYPSRTEQLFSFTKAANGSIVAGMLFDKQVRSVTGGTATRYENITFLRNYYTAELSFYTSTNDTFINMHVINNVFYGYITGSNAYGQSVVAGQFAQSVSNSIKWWTGEISNNVFLRRNWGANTYNAVRIGATHKEVVIDHNLFLTGAYSIPLVSGDLNLRVAIYSSGLDNQLITNNIFYNCYPVQTGASDAFDNNITYAGAAIPLIPSGFGSSYGSDNINNTNPLMNAVFTSPDNPDFDFALDNVGLQSGSPCINAGNDGTNIGPTGGLYPIYNANATYLTGEPTLPSVRQLIITGGSTVPPGGTLNVQVTGKKIN